MGELLGQKPLFPGKSEIDQLNKIFKELGKIPSFRKIGDCVLAFDSMGPTRGWAHASFFGTFREQITTLALSRVIYSVQIALKAFETRDQIISCEVLKPALNWFWYI